jgi:hypothetical protein
MGWANHAISLTLKGLAKKGFVGFYNAFKLLGFMHIWLGQKTMPPAK